MERDPSTPPSQEQPGVSLNKPAAFEPPAFESSFTPPGSSQPPSPAAEPSNEELNLATIAHAAGIVAPFFPGFGFIAPLVLWQINKGVKPFAASHAVEALNFQLTLLLALIVSFLLMFVLIGFLIMPVVGIWGFVLSIIATIKVSTKEPFAYPLTIRFIRKSEG